MAKYVGIVRRIKTTLQNSLTLWEYEKRLTRLEKRLAKSDEETPRNTTSLIPS
jgi:hypothetical protein